MSTNLDASTTHNHLIPPHGGALINLNVGGERTAELKAESRDFPSWNLTARHIRDLELLLNGGFSPLRGFMNQGRLRKRLPQHEAYERRSLADADYARCQRIFR